MFNLSDQTAIRLDKAKCGQCRTDNWAARKTDGSGCDICAPHLFRHLDDRPNCKPAPPAPEARGLPADAAARKGVPIFSGCVCYFPVALAAVAQLSRIGNDQHNPGQPLHWAKEKSTDELDCLLRHATDAAIDPMHRDPDGVLAAVKMAWRALANLQRLHDSGKNIFAEGKP